jgi:general secretion pathway protein G
MPISNWQLEIGNRKLGNALTEEDDMNDKRRTRTAGAAGFTLVEILLVVVIIGMLATIAAINVPKFLGQGREGKVKADLNSISAAVEAYNMVEGKYPGSLQDLTSGNDPYLKSLPKDPWGSDYQYNVPSSHPGHRYDVYSNGENGNQIGTWNIGEKTGSKGG